MVRRFLNRHGLATGLVIGVLLTAGIGAMLWFLLLPAALTVTQIIQVPGPRTGHLDPGKYFVENLQWTETSIYMLARDQASIGTEEEIQYWKFPDSIDIRNAPCVQCSMFVYREGPKVIYEFIKPDPPKTVH